MNSSDMMTEPTPDPKTLVSKVGIMNWGQVWRETCTALQIVSVTQLFGKPLPLVIMKAAG